MESTRGPGFNRWPQCVHCVLVKVHLLQLPVEDRETNEAPADFCNAGNTDRVTACDKNNRISYRTMNDAELLQNLISN